MGIILKSNNIDDIRKYYKELKLDKMKEIQKNLIKIKQIIIIHIILIHFYRNFCKRT